MLGRRVHVTGPAQLKLRAELKKVYTAGPSSAPPHGGERLYGFVYRLLTEAGTTLRRRGGSGLDRRRTLTAARPEPKPAGSHPRS
ncbi:helix-turn-helix domain-containing protein [Streptomyces olivaceus]|uniref:helix-turn-helix domain-containing protein n=1 Tax=Streptomyces olivaceus TaxID=47716 RepID=UPI0036373A93